MFFTGNWEMLSGMLDTVGHSQAPKVLTSHLTQKKLVYKNITLTYFREESGYFWLSKHTHHDTHEDSLVKWILSFHLYLGSRDQPWVARLMLQAP